MGSNKEKELFFLPHKLDATMKKKIFKTEKKKGIKLNLVNLCC